MFSRLLNPPSNRSFFLFGPRGTGKTTWVKTTFPQAVYLDLLEAEIFNDLLVNPERLKNYIPNAYRDFVIIDEVQRVPELLNEVHRLIESEHLKFILTGSSARKLRKHGHNLLGGRALTYFMYPLTAVEEESKFDLVKGLQFGGLPSIFDGGDPQKYLESYVQTYLQEEIFQEGLTRNLSAFARFLEIASFSQGEILNVTKVAQEAAVERKTVENYFQILEDLLIGHRLPAFACRAKRRVVSHPKFYYFDTGVYRTLRPAGPLDQPEMIEGAALESLFLQNLLAINESLGMRNKVYYWRTATGIEVDFVVYDKRGIFAFEIKRTAKISGQAVRGLKHFGREYPQAKCFLIYGGTRKMREGKIDVWPIADALKSLPQILGKKC